MLRVYNISGSDLTVEGVKIPAGSHADLSVMRTKCMSRLEANRRISIFEIKDPLPIIEEPVAVESTTQSRKSKRNKSDEESGELLTD